MSDLATAREWALTAYGMFALMEPDEARKLNPETSGLIDAIAAVITQIGDTAKVRRPA